MNMFKKNGGFTLVELIVVIAILAILAAVAVPAYSGYISKANKAADEQLLVAVETAMAAALSMEGKDTTTAASYFTATYDATTEEVTIAKQTKDPGVDADKVWGNFTAFYGNDVTVKMAYYDVSTNAFESLLDVVAVTAGAPATPPAGGEDAGAGSGT